MAAKLIQARDLRGTRRDRLVDVVPLPAPWTMFIDVCNACNFRCSYCPTGDTALLQQVGRKNKLMTWELFTKVVDDMRAFPGKRRILNLYKDGESLIHPRFCDMVSYLRAANVTEKIWVKTNGSLLTPEYNQRLVTCGLDMIGISVQHVHAQGFWDISKARIDYDQYRANILDLYQRRGGMEVSIKIADVGLSESDKQKFLDDFSDRCDYIAIEGLHGWSASDVKDWRLGTDNSFDGTPRVPKVACPLVMYMLTVNSNGKVSICNDDWQQAHDIGDVNKETLIDIWRGKRLQDFRLMHLTGRRDENISCRGCDYVSVLPDSIDDDREAMAERIR